MSTTEEPDKRLPTPLSELEKSTAANFAALLNDFMRNFGTSRSLSPDTVAKYYEVLGNFPEAFILDVMDEFIHREHVARLPSTSEFMTRLALKVNDYNREYDLADAALNPAPDSNWELGRDVCRVTRKLLLEDRADEIADAVRAVYEAHGVQYADDTE
jgi:hypothetical protein